MRISQKLFLTLTAIVMLTLTSVCTLLYFKSEHELQSLSSTYGKNLAEQVAQFAAEPLFAKDLLSLNVVVTQLQSAEHLAYAAILDTEMTPLAEIGNKPESGTDGVYQVPIRFQATRAGYAVIAVDQDKIHSAVSGTIYMLLVLFAIILGIAAIVISGMTKHIVNGINATTNAFNQLAQGKVGTSIDINRSDELGELIKGFNDMSHGLEERDQLMNPEHTKPMSQRRNDIMTNGYVHITHVFVDLSEINRHIDKLSADGCSDLLNIYTQLITLAAHHYDSDYCRFDREGIAIRFLASEPQEAANACLDAICASQLALRLVDRLNQTRFQRNLPTIRVSIGLHQGFGFASQIRNDHAYTAFLSEVDSDAIRLAKFAPRSKVAISNIAVETANAGPVVQLSQQQVHPMSDFYSELRFATISGLSPQLRKPIQQQADELFHAVYPQVHAGDDAEYDDSPEYQV